MFTFSLSVYSVIFLQNNPGSLQCLVYLYSASFRVFFLDVPPPPLCVCVCVCVCVCGGGDGSGGDDFLLSLNLYVVLRFYTAYLNGFKLVHVTTFT